MKANPTKRERADLWTELSKKFDLWMMLDDESLLREVQKETPSAIDATRDLCIKILVMTHTDKMVGRR